MKRLFLLFLAVLMVLSLAACGGGTKASDKAVSVAEKAIEVVDSYLNGDMDADAARDEIVVLKEEMEYVDDLTEKDDNKATDFSIQTSLTVLSSNILNDSTSSDSDSHDKVLETRNKLAEKAGLKKK